MSIYEKLQKLGEPYEDERNKHFNEFELYFSKNPQQSLDVYKEISMALYYFIYWTDKDVNAWVEKTIQLHTYISNNKDKLNFLNAFLTILGDEFSRCDKWRMDKIYWCMRQVLATLWDLAIGREKEDLKYDCISVIYYSVFEPSKESSFPKGFVLHFLYIYLEELDYAFIRKYSNALKSGDKPSKDILYDVEDSLIFLLNPIFSYLKYTNDYSNIQTVFTQIFDKLYSENIEPRKYRVLSHIDLKCICLMVFRYKSNQLESEYAEFIVGNLKEYYEKVKTHVGEDAFRKYYEEDRVVVNSTDQVKINIDTAITSKDVEKQTKHNATEESLKRKRYKRIKKSKKEEYNKLFCSSFLTGLMRVKQFSKASLERRRKESVALWESMMNGMTGSDLQSQLQNFDWSQYTNYNYNEDKYITEEQLKQVNVNFNKNYEAGSKQLSEFKLNFNGKSGFKEFDFRKPVCNKHRKPKIINPVGILKKRLK